MKIIITIRRNMIMIVFINMNSHRQAFFEVLE